MIDYERTCALITPFCELTRFFKAELYKALTKYVLFCVLLSVNIFRRRGLDAEK